MTNRGLMLKKQEMIDAMMGFFETGQEIYGECPCCGDIFRVSEIRVFYGKKPPKDWLDRLEEKGSQLDEDRKQFEQDRDKIVSNAIERSRVIYIGKTLEHIAPIFPQVEHHPRDVRGLFDPIDYVAFNGMFEKKSIDSISFIEIKTGKSKLTPIQRKIRDAVEDQRVEWKMYNITDIIEKNLEKSKKKSGVLKDFA
jgi:predicted Holliday junction resolvase-like endonuclease